MTDYAFYNDLGPSPTGPKRVLTVVRRAFRRVLRPIFVRNAEILAAHGLRHDAAESSIKDLHTRIDRTNDQLQATIAFGWDYVAMARRLAALEDRVEALTARDEAARGPGDQPSLPFPEFEADRLAEAS